MMSTRHSEVDATVPIDEVNEGLQKFGAGPRVAWIVFAGETTC